MLDFPPNTEHVKPTAMPADVLVDLGKQNLKLQKLEAQKNAEKQRYYNSKVDHLLEKTFQTKASKVKFDVDFSNPEESDEWM